LFSYVNSVYFGGDQATFNARMASLGQADNQWPYTFTQQPSQVPTVVKTVSLAQRPTAVKTSVFGGASRAWIATQDGTLHIYSLDGYANGGSAGTGGERPDGGGHGHGHRPQSDLDRRLQGRAERQHADPGAGEFAHRPQGLVGEVRVPTATAAASCARCRTRAWPTRSPSRTRTTSPPWATW
jgi:hypothetical protein